MAYVKAHLYSFRVPMSHPELFWWANSSPAPHIGPPNNALLSNNVPYHRQHIYLCYSSRRPTQRSSPDSACAYHTPNQTAMELGWAYSTFDFAIEAFILDVRLDTTGTCGVGVVGCVLVVAPPTSIICTCAVDPAWAHHVWNQTPETSSWTTLGMELDARGSVCAC